MENRVYHLLGLVALSAFLLVPGCSGGQQGFDYDGDGWEDDVDCEPSDPAIHPAATEICSDGLDNDCDGRVDGLDRGCNPHVSTESRWRTASPGIYHACALADDDTVHCWGCGSAQFDLGQCEPASGEFVQVTTGNHHACALRASGAVQCWGLDDRGQTAAPDASFVRISSGGNHTCGVLDDATLECWGDDGMGQATPPAGEFEDVAAGYEFSCGVRSGGGVECWGCSDMGADALVCFPPESAHHHIVAGTYHACALQSDGGAVCWGNDLWGMIEEVEGTFVALAAGTYHTCGVREPGELVCWGCDGADTEDGACEPPVATLDQMSAWSEHSCGVVEGYAVCWGRCAFGECTPP